MVKMFSGIGRLFRGIPAMGSLALFYWVWGGVVGVSRIVAEKARFGDI